VSRLLGSMDTAAVSGALSSLVSPSGELLHQPGWVRLEERVVEAGSCGGRTSIGAMICTCYSVHPHNLITVNDTPTFAHGVPRHRQRLAGLHREVLAIEMSVYREIEGDSAVSCAAVSPGD
jgi:hypothetical protein